MSIIEKIVNHHKFLGRDKLEHFYTSALGFALFSFVFNPVVASIAVASVALAKELLYDRWLGKGNTEFLDVFMSCLPIILYWLIQL